MQATTYQVKDSYGCDAQLWSDDTFTLHFGQGFEDQGESTPQDLAMAVALASLAEIAATGASQNDRDKAAEALAAQV